MSGIECTQKGQRQCPQYWLVSYLSLFIGCHFIYCHPRVFDCVWEELVFAAASYGVLFCFYPVCNLSPSLPFSRFFMPPRMTSERAKWSMLDEDHATDLLQSFWDPGRWINKMADNGRIGYDIRAKWQFNISSIQKLLTNQGRWWCLDIACLVLLMKSGMSKRPFSTRVIMQFIINPNTELYAFWTTLQKFNVKFVSSLMMYYDFGNGNVPRSKPGQTYCLSCSANEAAIP